MQRKVGPVTINHYTFRSSDQIQLGFNYTRENFFPFHPHTTHDLSVNYGRGCVYVEWKRKNK